MSLASVRCVLVCMVLVSQACVAEAGFVSQRTYSSFSHPVETKQGLKSRSKAYSHQVSRFAHHSNEGFVATENEDEVNVVPKFNHAKRALATVLLGVSLTMSPLSAPAYESADYASETVTDAVQNLNNAAGNVEQSFSAYEDIAAIITEGKGVGGSLSYTGVKLERGYVADEDTTIYNPGLSLLTESEKERLVDAIVKNRKVGLQKNSWSENNQFAFDFLKQKLDPLHMYELRGYLGILPFYGAAVYLATLFVQQNIRSLFPAAYIIGAVAVFGPIAALIAFGS
eukprot:CAMPEP_0183307690 /NCGR_PEP_ID=MMETSP0160_2-20130417/18729_1 /TAXON_ID=2839 ORGANISM="Odontella Sinensis, Strain Grunow 1884" /NCGR_SAMPLE_ID=MMETSP0160_2 /ASSEMBLY_ACC=CAM_ASM_000250 /LENGTH=283 /DNA_ID=CAMNT_0025471331 /DNA_START=53 /DNA_END=904 /DNA_ORIENTATION=+